MMTLKPFASIGLSTRVRIKEDAKIHEETKTAITNMKNREHVVMKCCSSHEVTTFSSKHEIRAHVGS